MRLVDEIGFDPVDGGPLAESWRQQPGSPCYANDLTLTLCARRSRPLHRSDRPSSGRSSLLHPPYTALANRFELGPRLIS
jgi:hypothetical protein